MHAKLILLPPLMLAGWTLLVMLLIPFRRFAAAFAGQVTAEDFRHGESGRVPARVSVPNRVLMNLLEVPVLFYLVSVTLFLVQQVDRVALMLAWSYVALRVVHSLIYLSYNQVLHRFGVFATSNLVLLALWIEAVRALL